MAGKGQKLARDGRRSDLTFGWLTYSYGDEWETWRSYAETWMAAQHKGTSTKLRALGRFFERYLISSAPYAADIMLFFKGYNGHVCSTHEFVVELKKTISDRSALSSYPNYVFDFIDWIINTNFSKPNVNGTPVQIVDNPMVKMKRQLSSTETVRNPLPYRHIQDLRKILCPNPRGDFKDWVWAQQQTGQHGTGSSGDWFEVDSVLIDKTDPDCVWRSKEVNRNSKSITIHQIWSPAKAMAVFVKLHLPLRTHQVRMLDSGEADTWRYEKGEWIENKTHPFALGSAKYPFAKGVFNRMYDSLTGEFSTGLYINTNKTADQNKDEIERGYTIPWQNDNVLYWLEKLRNWQERYNPIQHPTSCTTLLNKHTGIVKSEQALREMGEICFLFRDASAKGADRSKPLTNALIAIVWYQLLMKLEDQLFARGETLSNGERLKLVAYYPEGTQETSKISTLFPLHSLRVSLITHYVMYTPLPLPIVSKLLAGHTRLLMTTYYNKITPSMMTEKMDEAHQNLEANEQQSLRTFLKDAEASQIQCKAVYHNEDSIMAALADRNPIGWENRSCGLCLVGGNTVKSDEVSTLGGCWNGGELIKEAKVAQCRVYGAVPHGPENCVRCRWFITDARYLPPLNAHFNQVGYKAHQAANLAIELEAKIEVLEDEQYYAEEQGLPFNKQAVLQQQQRRYEKQLVEADEYAKDWIATFNLITRIMKIEEQRDVDDNKDKLVAVGDSDSLSYSLRFIETKSEMLHLSLLCDDAEFYPDLEDDLRKTPAIEKRSRQLNRVLMKKGFEPIFMAMDDKQQLVAGNAMLRQMAKIADPDDKLEGYRKVAGYLEAEVYLKDSKLLESGIDKLTEQAISLDSITKQALLQAK